MVKNSIVGGLKEEGVGEGGDIIPAFWSIMFMLRET